MNPIWKETFQFPIIKGSDGILKVIVKDHDPVGYDDIQGVVHIRLNSHALAGQGKVDKEYNLKRPGYYEPHLVKKRERNYEKGADDRKANLRIKQEESNNQYQT